MLRRYVVPALLGVLTRFEARASARLDAFLGSTGAAALVVDVRTHGLIAMGGTSRVGRSLSPPGSTLKPFVLSALIKTGKLRADASFPCPIRLRIGTHVLDCSHPPLATPMRIDTAIAYSCNCFVAHAAERFGPGELARELESAGFASRTGLTGGDEAAGRIQPAMRADAQRLQALGEDGVLITVAELAAAYRLLAIKIGLPEMQPILAGLEGAVEFGNAQHARVAGVQVAGKTGSVLTAAGEPIAWFAGFLPSRAPEVVVAVMQPGRSGGADAAPIAGRILAEYRAGKL
jgi:peptidoglycan glycosyltransferase